MVKNTFSALVVCLALIAAGLAGCRQGADEGLKIGLIAELTGQIPAVGASCKNAAELALQEINSAGGIEIRGKKYPLSLAIQDSASRPEQAAAAAQKLITQAGVLAIVGPNSSGNAIPAAEIAEKAGVVLITPWSTDPKTTLDNKTGKHRKYIYRACFTEQFQGQVLGKFARTALKAQKAAALYDVGSDVLESQTRLFKKSFEKEGGTMVAIETYSTGDRDFSAQLTKIKNASPDVIMLPSYYTSVPLQVQQAHRLGLNVPFLGSDAWSTEELITMCGKDCEGFFFFNHYSPSSNNPLTKKFVEAYKTRYNAVPDDVAALTYDAMGLLHQALIHAAQASKEGTITRAAVLAGMEQIRSFKGVTGEMTFSPGSGDPLKGGVILQIKNGKFVWFADAQP